MMSQDSGLLAASQSETPHKKSKHDKSEHKSKKRHRESRAADGSERKHKRSKSEAAHEHEQDHSPSNVQFEPQDPDGLGANGEPPEHDKKKKKSKHKRDAGAGSSQAEDRIGDAPGSGTAPGEEDGEMNKKDKSQKKEKKRSKKHRSTELEPDGAQREPSPPAETPRREKKDKKEKKHKKTTARRSPSPDAMDVDPSSPGQGGHGNDIDKDNVKPYARALADDQYPFYTQTVSQYLPLFPSGLVEPVQGYADQHLRPLLNRYVPSLGGVLLAYRSPRVGEAPGRASLTESAGNNSNDEDENDDDDAAVLLESVNEYAVTFGWLTAEVDLFRPARGAWLEGRVNLQSGGHVGVVCWGMFNASVEAERLPAGWRWVDLLSEEEGEEEGGDGNDKDAEHQDLNNALAADENGVSAASAAANTAAAAADAAQVHTSGYWADADGLRVRAGARLRFRIRNYEVGVSGDYGYLSIEGTMLDEAAEAARTRDEAEAKRRRKLHQQKGGSGSGGGGGGGGLLRREQKRLPEFSMTKFGGGEEEEGPGQGLGLGQAGESTGKKNRA
ncbi:hypothetical protein GGR56DRAFT_698324 [Xylariaceae sp. FL0804]|nr:hypothetical protein GGR56DRAFT_698324 [Xylariaceae sp. FL0804]